MGGECVLLQTLTLHNVALIEDLQIQFHNGLHVLSGETGAGKSIVVDAVNLILGGRADRDLIRTGTDKAVVEAFFNLPEHSPLYKKLEDTQIECEDSVISIRREIGINGKNLCRVCGVIVPVSFLREAAPMLMDIHGQHDHQFLMNPDLHLGFLDRIGNEKHEELLQKTEAACTEFMAIHRKYAKLMKKNEQKQIRIEKLEAELSELHEAKIREGEEAELEASINQMRNAQKIREALQSAYEFISLGDREGSCLDRIKSAQNKLKSLASYSEKMDALFQRCESLYYELEELSFEIYQISEQNEMRPGQLEQAENRLDLIHEFKRRYGETIQDILLAQRHREEEYSELCSLDDQISQVGADHKRLLAEYRALAKELSQSRKEMAVYFEENMQRELKELGMGATVFKTRFKDRRVGQKPAMPQPRGDDEAEFLISPNPGEPLKPLAKIASGGELSRLMLAIKSLEAGHSGVDAMVFDEIDTGISGRTAQVVAEKMRKIAEGRQVICVTHLPQIAAAADHEYLVHKEVTGERTVTQVQELDAQGRIREIARMISGAEGITPDAAVYAKKMLDAYGER